ncbi:putative kelch-type beta propeller, F-box associated interaction domain-containing protein [Helianthus annuus]|nr:putative kelch-type beta propeller, F-box associated interaction domain-containing protein [Helianthus annuus]
MRAEKDVLSTFVYTIKTDSWREIAFSTPPLAYLSQCLFNGVLHWAVKRYLTDLSDDCRSYILTFDLSSEVFSTIELPEPSWETNHVTIINGSLAVLCSKHYDKWIWVRSNTIGSWSVAYKLNPHIFGHVLRVFQVTSNDVLMIKQKLPWITIYNPETQTQRIYVVGLSVSCNTYVPTLCVESLGLLDMGTSCDERKEIT